MTKVRSALLASVAIAAVTTPLMSGSPTPVRASSPHMALSCRHALCPEVANSEEVFGHDVYVGHDEPSNTFYSNVPGSGNNVRWQLRLPTDPSPTNPNQAGKSFTFQNNTAFWFGMALCDTQSYPEQISTCPADSDKNVLDPSISPRHAGTAFTELQFYPPGWVPWPVFATAIGAGSCDPTKWCAAMNIFSVLEDPVNGTVQNSTCAGKVGIETFTFAFVTRNGKTQAPPNPVQSTLATFTPDPTKDLFMSSGDNLMVTLHDTAHGLQTVINDTTSGQSGSMTASAANGFAQIKYDPSGTSCIAMPYDFHPMYSTSSEKTRVIWAAHTYNVGFTSEIGHFEHCVGPNPIPTSASGAVCPTGNTEETRANSEPTDSDETTCFPPSMSTRIQIAGCTDSNVGFDGYDYQPVWPDGNKLRPTSVLYSSPLTGAGYNVAFNRAGFEADLPRIEGTCDRSTGVGCTLIPTTDEGVAANFYPFFSSTGSGASCRWQFGNHIPGSSNDYGQNAEFGTLLAPTYLVFGGHGATTTLINDFRGIVPNTC
jgi:hypothetical protein